MGQALDEEDLVPAEPEELPYLEKEKIELLKRILLQLGFHFCKESIPADPNSIIRFILRRIPSGIDLPGVGNIKQDLIAVCEETDRGLQTRVMIRGTKHQSTVATSLRHIHTDPAKIPTHEPTQAAILRGIKDVCEQAAQQRAASRRLSIISLLSK